MRSLPFVLVGLGLACAALLSAIVVAVLTTGGGYRWPDSAVVPTDGSPTTVRVDEGRDVLLWTEGGAASCVAADLDVRPLDGTLRRDGKAFDWTATATLGAAPSAFVTVACDGPGSIVLVQSAPRIPLLAGVDAWFAVPALLGLASLVSFGGAVGARLRAPALTAR